MSAPGATPIATGVEQTSSPSAYTGSGRSVLYAGARGLKIIHFADAKMAAEYTAGKTLSSLILGMSRITQTSSCESSIVALGADSHPTSVEGRIRENDYNRLLVARDFAAKRRTGDA